MTVKGILWFEPEWAYYGLPIEGQPEPAKYGTEPLYEGRVFTVTGKTRAAPESQWIKFEIENSEGVKAVVYMPRQANDYGLKAGIVFPTAYTLMNSHLEQPDDLYVVCTIFDGVIHSEPDGSANVVKKIPAGTVLHVMREMSGNDDFVEVKYIGADGLANLGYFDMRKSLAVQIKDGQFYERLVLFSGNWEQVPFLDEIEPEPEPAPEPWYIKFWNWLREVWQKILDWFRP